MSYTYRTRNVSTGLTHLADRILESGSNPGDGSTRELRNVQVTLTNPLEREVLVIGRRASLPAQIAETIWVLSGRNDIGWLSRYLPRAPQWSDDGETWRGAYGPRLRSWGGPGGVDQLQVVLDRLLDTDTRQAVVMIYDPSIDSSPGKDIPCNNWLHFLYRDGALHLHVATRSNDLMWGWSGINAFEWSTLLEMMAGMAGMPVGELTFSISSLHLYTRHFARARKMGLGSSETLTPTPRFDPANYRTWDDLDALFSHWFDLERAIREDPDNPEVMLKVVDFPEPMLRSWLVILGAHWSQQVRYSWLGMSPVDGTALEAAYLSSPQAQPPVKPTPEEVAPEGGPGKVTPEGQAFLSYVINLHEEKHLAYGDSWKRRGEQIGIMANIARKVDRLGVGGAGDTAADTVVDLLVYLVKYRLWLSDFGGAAEGLSLGRYGDPLSDLHTPVAELLTALSDTVSPIAESDVQEQVGWLIGQYDVLEGMVQAHDPGRRKAAQVEEMMAGAYPLARLLWEKEQWMAGNDTRVWKGYEVDLFG